MMPGTIGMQMPARRTRSTNRLEEIVVEEELGDRAVGAGIHLALQRSDLGVPVGALRVLLRIGRHRDLGGAGQFQCLARAAPCRCSRADAARRAP